MPYVKFRCHTCPGADTELEDEIRDLFESRFLAGKAPHHSGTDWYSSLTAELVKKLGEFIGMTEK